MSYKARYTDPGLLDYREAWSFQEKIFNNILEKKSRGEQAPGTLIFLEHPHVYTLGKSGSQNNLLIDYIQLSAKNATFVKTDRGGDITYHGPGQIVGYPIFDLEAIGIGLKEYVHRLEEAVIRTSAEFGISCSRLKGGTGVWIDPEVSGRARKICAIGVKASHFVTMHGFAFNVNTDLAYFNYINPCGFTDKGVTSLQKETGEKQSMDYVKSLLKSCLREIFDLEWIID